MTLYEELKWRGLIKDVTSPDLEDKLNNEKLTFYIGTDPTADSMHLGHLSSFLISKRLADRGHKPILLLFQITHNILLYQNKLAMKLLQILQILKLF